jgi:hypothetical protein
MIGWNGFFSVWGGGDWGLGKTTTWGPQTGKVHVGAYYPPVPSSLHVDEDGTDVAPLPSLQREMAVRFGWVLGQLGARTILQLSLVGPSL